MAIDAALLRANGVEVFGGRHRLRYDFDALEKLEAEFDGLDNFLTGLSTWTKRLRTVRRALVIGTKLPDEAVGALLNEGIDLAQLIEAINDALSQGLGLELLVDGNDSPKARGSSDSLGESSITSPLSVMDVQTLSSGE